MREPPPPRFSAPPVQLTRPPLVSAPPGDAYPRPKPARSLPIPSSAPQASARPPAPQSVAPPNRATAGNRAEAAYLRRLGSMQSIPRMVRPMQDLELDQRSGFVCSFIDGASTIEDIIDVSSVPKLEVLRILDDLVAQGGVSVE
jgi:hypothetical protein